jgi:hypothetical protein
MKLTITLSPIEEANLRAWVQWYQQHPEAVGKPSGAWNGGKPDYQTRVVLEEQTRERYDEIAAQFAGGGSPQPVPPVGEIPWPAGFQLAPEPLVPGDVGVRQLTFRPGVVEWYVAPRAGRAGCSETGGGAAEVWCGISDQKGVLRPEPLTKRGAGGVDYTAVPEGWVVMMFCPHITENRPGRYDLALP